MRYKNSNRKKDPLLTENGETLRVNMIGRFLREKFGHKVVKLSLDGGFTCPTRDGTLGTEGCLFCGSNAGGDFASTIEEQIILLKNKWPDSKYLAYFQNHTNTYAPVDVLRDTYNKALSTPDMEGIAIATRPDCLPEDVLDLLSELNRQHFLWVELGLQTVNDKTAALINRGYSLSVYDDAMRKLCARGIPTVTHLILGLPGDTREDMLASAAHVASQGSWGIKLHLLNVVHGARLAEEYPDYVPFDSMEEYISLVCDIIQILPPEMVVHRLTGDVARKDLIAPTWSYRKRTILNGITAELRRRNTWQGSDL